MDQPHPRPTDLDETPRGTVVLLLIVLAAFAAAWAAMYLFRFLGAGAVS